MTVPAGLIDGFNCGFIMYAAGTVTLAPAANVVNRSAKTALSTQYQAGSLMVAKATGAGSGATPTAEYLVGGDFA